MRRSRGAARTSRPSRRSPPSASAGSSSVRACWRRTRDKPAELKSRLDAKGLALLCFSSGSNPEYAPGREAEIVGKHVANARFVRALGGKVLQIISKRPKDRAPTPAEYEWLGGVLNAIGRQTAGPRRAGRVPQPPERLRRSAGRGGARDGRDRSALRGPAAGHRALRPGRRGPGGGGEAPPRPARHAPPEGRDGRGAVDRAAGSAKATSGWSWAAAGWTCPA